MDDPGRTGALVVRGHGDSSTGYGRMLAHLMKGIEARGVRTAFSAITVVETRVPMDPFLRGRLLAEHPEGPCLYVASPGEIPAGAVAFTMWESSIAPPEHVAGCNRARAVVVPNRWNAGVFAASGVRSPIRVVGLGCDLASYYPTPRVEGADFVVLNVSRLAHGATRKGVHELVAAFLEAVGDRPDARLRLKLSDDCPLDDPGHPRITIDRSSYDDAGMRALYATASVYATLTKGEGWAMPVHEAMACGRPVVAPIHSGLAEFVTPECGWPIEWSPEPAGAPFYEGHGDWMVASHASAVAQIRAAYADVEGRRTRGEAAARRAAEFTWERTAVGVLEVLREFGLVPGLRAVEPPLGQG